MNQELRIKNKTIHLYLDTSDNKKTVVNLKKDGEKFEEIEEHEKPRSASTLQLIEKILTKNSVNVSDLTNIHVNKGPGSFTGIRVGVSIANALGFSLNIPVNDKKIGEFEQPEY